MPEAPAAKKPKIPAEEHVANYIRKELNFSGNAIEASAVRVSAGNRGETRITVSDAAIKKLGGADTFSQKLTKALSGFAPNFKASGKPLADGTVSQDTVFSVEGISPADLALETLGFGVRNDVNRR